MSLHLCAFSDKTTFIYYWSSSAAGAAGTGIKDFQTLFHFIPTVVWCWVSHPKHTVNGGVFSPWITSSFQSWQAKISVVAVRESKLKQTCLETNVLLFFSPIKIFFDFSRPLRRTQNMERCRNVCNMWVKRAIFLLALLAHKFWLKKREETKMVPKCHESWIIAFLNLPCVLTASGKMPFPPTSAGGSKTFFWRRMVEC